MISNLARYSYGAKLQVSWLFIKLLCIIKTLLRPPNSVFYKNKQLVRIGSLNVLWVNASFSSNTKEKFTSVGTKLSKFSRFPQELFNHWPGRGSLLKGCCCSWNNHLTSSQSDLWRRQRSTIVHFIMSSGLIGRFVAGFISAIALSNSSASKNGRSL